MPTGGSAADFARQIAAESANNARIIEAAGIKANCEPGWKRCRMASSSP